MNRNPVQSDHTLMCKQWWRVCWIYGDQEKFYRQLYGRKSTGKAIVTSTSSSTASVARDENFFREGGGGGASGKGGECPRKKRNPIPTISSSIPNEMDFLFNIPGIPPRSRIPLFPCTGAVANPVDGIRELDAFPRTGTKKRSRGGEMTTATTITTVTVERQILAQHF
ncbi:UNVERIFIED_CONTAM: hypothetical protein PYX00_000586 [Menopon gallinae]|uniref:Uncharacterized protein n=1 Tax=Menopon gallinae TaxID=328185 RepID=A0AAW2IAW9_9NEOP